MEYGANPDLEDVRGKSARNLDAKFFAKYYKNVLPSEEEILTEKYFQSPVNPAFNKKNVRKKKPIQEPKKTPQAKKEKPLPKWVEDYSKSTTPVKPKSVPSSVNTSINGNNFSHKVSQSSVVVEVKDEEKSHKTDTHVGMFNLLPSWLDSFPGESTIKETKNEENDITRNKEIVTLSRELTKLHGEVDEVKQFLEDFSNEGEATLQPPPLPLPPRDMMRDHAIDINTLDRQITSLRDDVKNVTKCLEEISGQ